MRRRFYFGLFIAGLLIALGAASLERSPGYMDADYYYAGAQRLASGQGASEPYIWNYLNDPAGLPAPSFSYWMPLASLLAAVGLKIAGGWGFWGARLGFLLLAACIPPLTALLSLHLTNKPAQARLAGLLALFPGFYLAYLPTTDAFPMLMVLGGLFMLLSLGRWRWLERRPAEVRLFGLGVLSGLLHMTRADGVLWLAGGLVTALIWFRQARDVDQAGLHWPRLLSFGAVVLAGYGLVMAPWFARNVQTWGSLFPPGGSRAVWITEYEQTMAYPAALLTSQHWLAAGWGAHFRAWLDALGNNFQTTLAIQGGIVLLPFILAGMWLLRGCWPVRLGAGMWLLTAVVMTVVFPFAGINGSFFHSGAALQPLFWAVAPVGIVRIVLWYARLRRLRWPEGMLRFVSVLLVVTGAVLSIALYFQRVAGSEPGGLLWNAGDRHYQEVERALAGLGAAPGDSVLVNNPPGFWLASGRPAIVVPYGDEQTLLAAARQYDIHYLVLEITNPPPLGPLYHAQVAPPELEYLASVGTTRLYKINMRK